MRLVHKTYRRFVRQDDASETDQTTVEHGAVSRTERSATSMFVVLERTLFEYITRSNIFRVLPSCVLRFYVFESKFAFAAGDFIRCYSAAVEG